MNNSTAKAKPKMTVKNGVVYGDALSAQEKKRIVMQKKKDRKAKKKAAVFTAAFYGVFGSASAGVTVPAVRFAR